MLEKTKNILAILLGALVAFSIIYGVFALIISAFKEPNIIKADEAKLYMIDSNTVTNYTRFYYIEDCFKNFVKSAQMKKYNELYNLYMEDYKDAHAKSAVFAKLEEFSDASSEYKLKKAFRVTDSLYIVQYTVDDYTDEMLMNVGTNKGKSYEYALLLEEE